MYPRDLRSGALKEGQWLIVKETQATEAVHDEREALVAEGAALERGYVVEAVSGGIGERVSVRQHLEAEARRYVDHLRCLEQLGARHFDDLTILAVPNNEIEIFVCLFVCSPDSKRTLQHECQRGARPWDSMKTCNRQDCWRPQVQADLHIPKRRKARDHHVS